MATDISAPLQFAYDEIIKRCGYKSAVGSGMRPDKAHLNKGGYHCSIEDLIRYGNRDDYSNTRPDDEGFNPDYGAAGDISMSLADMKRAYGFIRRAYADKTDPRRKYINAINCYDGSGDAERIDFAANTITRASADHKWHIHFEIRRRYLLLMKAAQALVSIMRGETKAQWIAAHPEDATPAQNTGNWTERLVDALPTIRKGSKGDAVGLAQHCLILRGVVGTSQWGAYCDKDFGKNTEADVKEFQGKVGLTKDGVIGEATWKALLTGKKQ